MLQASIRKTGIALVVLCFALCFGCAPAMQNGDGKAEIGKLETQIAPEAELVKLETFFKDFDGVKSLYFKVTLKNVSQEEQRFKVNIFLDSGKAVGGLIPRKTGKGLLKPGASASFSYPAKGQDTEPKEVMLIIKTMSK